LTFLVQETPMRPGSFPELCSSRERLLNTDDGEAEAPTGLRYELLGESHGGLGPTCNDDLVGRERRQSVRNGLQRIRITDVAPCVDAGTIETIDPRGCSFFSAAPGDVLVRHPVPEPRVQRRSHDQDLAVREIHGDRRVQRDDEYARCVD
jgi:hypothetical protein